MKFGNVTGDFLEKKKADEFSEKEAKARFEAALIGRSMEANR